LFKHTLNAEAKNFSQKIFDLLHLTYYLAASLLTILILSEGSPLPFDTKGSHPVPPRYWVVFFKEN
jgi:hypothetical protein